MSYRVRYTWLAPAPITSETDPAVEPEAEEHDGELVELFLTWDTADIAGDQWRTDRLLDDADSQAAYEIEYVDDGIGDA